MKIMMCGLFCFLADIEYFGGFVHANHFKMFQMNSVLSLCVAVWYPPLFFMLIPIYVTIISKSKNNNFCQIWKTQVLHSFNIRYFEIYYIWVDSVTFLKDHSLLFVFLYIHFPKWIHALLNPDSIPHTDTWDVIIYVCKLSNTCRSHMSRACLLG